MCEMEKIVFNLLTAYSMIGIYNEGFVFVDCFKNLQKPFLPGLVGLLPLEGLGRVLDTGPLHQVVDVLEVLV